MAATHPLLSDISPAAASLTLLRLSPLITASASLMFSWAQHLFFGSFVNPQLAAQPNHLAGRTLPHYMPALWQRGVVAIFVLYPSTLALALANGLSLGPLGIAAAAHPLARRCYLVSAVLSLAHFYYVPRVKRIVADINDAKNAGAKNEDAMRRWLAMHFERSVLVNLPAWLCLAVATVVELEKRVVQ